jgi:tetrahydromethanopterin S-methyltransferase subunit A
VSVPLRVVQKNIDEAVLQLREAAAARKCWPCGCLHSSLESIEEAFPRDGRPAELTRAMSEARDRLVDVEYDCLGCAVCYPANAINELRVDGDACPTDPVEEREGWPPLPGSYTVLRFNAAVAVCTLTDEELVRTVAARAAPEISIVGTMQTENLGIERLLQNTVANPHIRFVVVCGPDSRQAIGHLPGQSLVALASRGIDDRSGIIGARGKRPHLRNVSRQLVEHFRRTVEVIDLVGCTESDRIIAAAADCGSRNPGPAVPFDSRRCVRVIHGFLPRRINPDPAGYLVVYPDRRRRSLSVEHYGNNGVLDCIVEGSTPAEICTALIAEGLISQLDHAAYLGRELARAEDALIRGTSYVQDAAPAGTMASAQPGCGCDRRC